MELLSEFIAYAENIGINKEDFKIEQKEDFSIVIFNEEENNGELYNVMLVFYNGDNEIEIYISKKNKSDDNLFDILKHINNLNIEYRGITFFYQEDILSLKSNLHVNKDLQLVLSNLLMDMEVAKKEFAKISN